MRIFTIVACTAMFAAAAEAALEFENKVSRHEVEIGDESFKARFAFKNTGKVPVEIQRISTSCACLGAKSDKKVYQPGDEGIVEAEFALEGRTGELEKFVYVETNNPVSHDIRLTVKVSVPEIFSLEPTLLEWTLDEGAKPKRSTFKVLRDEPIHVLGALSMRQGVTARVHTVEAGRHYEIEVDPEDTSETMLGLIKIETDCEIQSQKNPNLFVRIAKPDRTE